MTWFRAVGSHGDIDEKGRGAVKGLLALMDATGSAIASGVEHAKGAIAGATVVFRDGGRTYCIVLRREDDSWTTFEVHAVAEHDVSDEGASA